MSNGVSKPFFAALLALFAREAGAGRERMIALVLDNAGWHTAPNLIVPEGLRLVYLPSYSPSCSRPSTFGLLSTSCLPTSTSKRSPISNELSQTVAESSMAISSVSAQTSLVAQASQVGLINRRS